jgi:hypothetical protein
MPSPGVTKLGKIYCSPTTPGLKVSFQSYIIERLCLNIYSRLEPYFWRDKTRWGNKFVMELRGVNTALKAIADWHTDPSKRAAIVRGIVQFRLTTLAATAERTRLLESFDSLWNTVKSGTHGVIMSEDARVEYTRKNATLNRPSAGGLFGKLNETGTTIP